MKIMITGATGGYGTYVIPFIKEFAPDAEIYGLARDKEKARNLEAKGVIPKIADYNDLNSLTDAFHGIERLLFISVPVYELQQNVVAAAKAAGIQFIAYTSIDGIEYSKFGLEINHRATEKLIQESGIPHTFLRDNWYLDMMQSMLRAIDQSGKFPYYAKDQKISWALKKDYAEVGARVITGEGYPEIINLAGKPVTYAEIGKAVEEVSGHSVDVYSATKEEFTTWMLKNGASQFDVMIAASYQDYTLAGNNGEELLTTVDFDHVLKRPLRSLSDAVKKLL